MKAISKIYHRGIEVFLPLAAVLLGILIMALQDPIAIQAYYPIPLPQSFSGEYSYDGETWYALESGGDLSAKKENLYLRGHFDQPIPEGSRLYYYSDHIGSVLFINGELFAIDSFLEWEQCGIPLQPALCSREWKFYYFAEEVPTDSLIEIHLKNPHKFGNKNAYQDFLATLCCTANEHAYLAKNLEDAAQPYNVIGILLAIVGALLLCSVLVSIFLRVPLGLSVAQTGLLAACAGGFFLLDTIDVSFRSESHILNTYGWQICMMYGVYLFGCMTRDVLTGKRRYVAGCVVAVLAAANAAMILLSFSGAVLIYDTFGFWVMLQRVGCPILMFCCAAELFSAKKNRSRELVFFPVVYSCILLDSMGFLGSINSRAVLTKAAVLLFFLLKLVQFVRDMIAGFSASNRARRLEKELEESRIALMLSQIQPHFIFNVLGTIRGLCRENPEQAWHGLGDFSAYLRANMNALTNEKAIPFEMELAHVEAYLRLEQMRMGERLNVVYDIRDKAFSIPPLMLQPLVENAVKHGLFYKAEGGTVVIRSVRNGNRIILSVQDDGIGFEAAVRESDFDQREHHGLENVRSRADKMLDGTLRIESRPEGGSTVTLEFPIDEHS